MNIVYSILSLLLYSIIFFSYQPLIGEDTPWDPLPQKTVMTPQASRQVISFTPSLWIISFHQQVLSSCDGPRSHFYPTSSEYMKYAVQKFGLRGVLLGLDRLMRENNDPWLYTYIQKGDSLRKWDPLP